MVNDNDYWQQYAQARAAEALAQIAQQQYERAARETDEEKRRSLEENAALLAGKASEASGRSGSIGVVGRTAAGVPYEIRAGATGPEYYMASKLSLMKPKPETQTFKPASQPAQYYSEVQLREDAIRTARTTLGVEPSEDIIRFYEGRLRGEVEARGGKIGGPAQKDITSQFGEPTSPFFAFNLMRFQEYILKSAAGQARNVRVERFKELQAKEYRTGKEGVELASLAAQFGREEYRPGAEYRPLTFTLPPLAQAPKVEEETVQSIALQRMAQPSTFGSYLTEAMPGLKNIAFSRERTELAERRKQELEVKLTKGNITGFGADYLRGGQKVEEIALTFPEQNIAFMRSIVGAGEAVIRKPEKIPELITFGALVSVPAIGKYAIEHPLESTAQVGAFLAIGKLGGAAVGKAYTLVDKPLSSSFPEPPILSKTITKQFAVETGKGVRQMATVESELRVPKGGSYVFEGGAYRSARIFELVPAKTGAVRWRAVGAGALFKELPKGKLEFVGTIKESLVASKQFPGPAGEQTLIATFGNFRQEIRYSAVAGGLEKVQYNLGGGAPIKSPDSMGVRPPIATQPAAMPIRPISASDMMASLRGYKSARLSKIEGTIFMGKQRIITIGVEKTYSIFPISAREGSLQLSTKPLSASPSGVIQQQFTQIIGPPFVRNQIIKSTVAAQVAMQPVQAQISAPFMGLPSFQTFGASQKQIFGTSQKQTFGAAGISFTPQLTKPFTLQLTKPFSPQITPPMTIPFTPQITKQFTPQLGRQITKQFTPQLGRQFTPPFTPQLTPPITPPYNPPFTPQLTVQFTPQLTPPITPPITPPFTPPKTPPFTPPPPSYNITPFKFPFPMPPMPSGGGGMGGGGLRNLLGKATRPQASFGASLLGIVGKTPSFSAGISFRPLQRRTKRRRRR